MKLSRALLLSFIVTSPLSLAACGDSSATTEVGGGNTTSTNNSTSNNGGNGGDGGSGAAGGDGGSGATAGGTTTGSGGSGGTTSSTTTTTTTSSSTSSQAVLDPDKDGPYQTAVKDDKVTVNGTSLNVHSVYPVDGPEAGPYPVVIIAHGFQLPVTQYYKYVDRLATFGYVALTVDFQAGFFGANNTVNAQELLAGLDWAETALPGKANANNAGMTGHSLGGKLSLLSATLDPRIKASIVLDPVDGGGGPGGGCQPPACIDVSALMPNLNIPTGFLGETTDAMGGFQPCAPAAENFLTFYSKTNSPSFAVTIKGANHMSFLDDVASCGLTCSFCNMATLPNAQVNAMSRAYVVAFYERYLRGNSAYETYLTGAKAQELYVTPGTATIDSK